MSNNFNDFHDLVIKGTVLSAVIFAITRFCFLLHVYLNASPHWNTIDPSPKVNLFCKLMRVYRSVQNGHRLDFDPILM